MNIINIKYNNLKKYSQLFKLAKPFPHAILDNFLDENFFKNLNLNEIIINKKKGRIFNTDIEKNKWASKNEILSNNLKSIIDELNKKDFLENLHKLTGITELFSTSEGNTSLANYHEMYESGFLGTHIDHSSEPVTGLPHVLNIILYLSKNWQKSWGGSTIFANKYGTKIEKLVDFKPNRAVIFLHSPFTFHGVTEIKNNLNKRSTIYVDYYSANKSPYDHLNLKFKNVWFKHPTTFILPNIKDYFPKKNRIYLKKMIKYRIKAFLC
tara:strand:+ start:1077 stop:1877 length:801 start_codon:yes stop_codon:yes gene_type:complete